MALKSEQLKLKGILEDTICLLVKSSIPYKETLGIDAIVGVTVDEAELFYLPLQKLVATDAQSQRKDKTVAALPSAKTRKRSAKVDSKQRCIRIDSESDDDFAPKATKSQKLMAEHNYSSPSKLSEVGGGGGGGGTAAGDRGVKERQVSARMQNALWNVNAPATGMTGPPQPFRAPMQPGRPSNHGNQANTATYTPQQQQQLQWQRQQTQQHQQQHQRQQQFQQQQQQYRPQPSGGMMTTPTRMQQNQQNFAAVPPRQTLPSKPQRQVDTPRQTRPAPNQTASDQNQTRRRSQRVHPLQPQPVTNNPEHYPSTTAPSDLNSSSSQNNAAGIVLTKSSSVETLPDNSLILPLDTNCTINLPDLGEQLSGATTAQDLFNAMTDPSYTESINQSIDTSAMPVEVIYFDPLTDTSSTFVEAAGNLDFPPPPELRRESDCPPDDNDKDMTSPPTLVKEAEPTSKVPPKKPARQRRSAGKAAQTTGASSTATSAAATSTASDKIATTVIKVKKTTSRRTTKSKEIETTKSQVEVATTEASTAASKNPSSQTVRGTRQVRKTRSVTPRPSSPKDIQDDRPFSLPSTPERRYGTRRRKAPVYASLFQRSPPSPESWALSKTTKKLKFILKKNEDQKSPAQEDLEESSAETANLPDLFLKDPKMTKSRVILPQCDMDCVEKQAVE